MKNLSISILLISMLTIANAAVTSVDLTEVTTPVMINREFNPLIGLNIISDDSDELSAVLITLEGTKAEDIAEISIYRSLIDEKKQTAYLGNDDPTEKLGTATSDKFRKGKAIIKCEGSLKAGDNHLWLSVKPTKEASLSRFIELKVVAIKTASDKKKVDAIAKQRIGIAITYPRFETDILKPETDKVLQTRTSKFSRIPGLTRTRRGTLVAVFDNRYGHNGDLPADIDVGVRTSTDGGQTWSRHTTCIAARDIPDIGRGVGDPAILIDKKTNRIWVAALAAPKSGHPIWASAAGTTDPSKCGQFILAYSDDEGKTWSKPINITKEVKRPDDSDTKLWGLVFNGPGNGITMRDGTLVFPAQVWADGGKGTQVGDKGAVLVYSKDRGETWTSSKLMKYGASESTVAELSDGSLMISTREVEREKGLGSSWTEYAGRGVAVTKDLGETWKRHDSMDTKEGFLISRRCQATLINIFNRSRKGKSVYNLGIDAKHLLLFSNPLGNRSEMAIRYSTDDGNSWNKGLMYDQRKCMGYTAIYPTDRNNLGVFYEGQGGYLYFVRLPFTEIVAAE